MSTRIRFDACAFALVAFVSAIAPPRSAHAGADAGADEGEDDPDLAQYRERFKQGLDRYESNDVAGALSYWEPLYRDLGPARGYRVGYNLARAYEVFGDVTRAAERYESFLDEVKHRRARGKSLDELVTSDEAKATARLEEIRRTRGRIHVAQGARPESVRIDQADPRLAGFVAYVAPGVHDVIFAPGSASSHVEHVTVQAGELVEVAAPAPPAVVEKPIHVELRDSLKHPFSSTWLWAFGAATVFIGGGLAGGAYANALVLYNHYASQPPAVGPTDAQKSDYNGARNLAYASLAIPAALAVTTAILLVTYAVKSKHVRIPVTAAFAF